MASDYGPEFDRFVKHIRTNVAPNLEKSKIFVSITPESPDKVDVKFAVELGLAIMYDKPIVAVIQPGTKIPEKLARVVERFVELDLKDPTWQDRLMTTIEEMLEEKGEQP